MEFSERVNEALAMLELLEKNRYTNFWYALFVKTGYEDQVRRQLSGFDFHNKINIFTPTKERIIKLPGQIKKERKEGYVPWVSVY